MRPLNLGAAPDALDLLAGAAARARKAEAEAAGLFTPPPAHYLVDMHEVMRVERKERAKRGHKPESAVPNKGDKRQKCSLEGCNRLPKRTRFFDPASYGGKGGFWHLPCFFERHKFAEEVTDK